MNDVLNLSAQDALSWILKRSYGMAHIVLADLFASELSDLATAANTLAVFAEEEAGRREDSDDLLS